MRPPFLRDPIDPARVRVIDGSFAFVPRALLRRGFFASLSHDGRSLYFFLLLAADRCGVSFYHDDSICSAFEWMPTWLRETDSSTRPHRSRRLALPGAVVARRPRLRSNLPLRTRAELELHDPATIERLIDETTR